MATEIKIERRHNIMYENRRSEQETSRMRTELNHYSDSLARYSAVERRGAPPGPEPSGPGSRAGPGRVGVGRRTVIWCHLQASSLFIGGEVQTRSKVIIAYRWLIFVFSLIVVHHTNSNILHVPFHLTQPNLTYPSWSILPYLSHFQWLLFKYKHSWMKSKRIVWGILLAKYLQFI